MKNLFTTTYHPQTNGQIERFNRTILAAIRHYVADHPKDWDLFTDALTFAYNTQVHTSTGCTPFELVLARPPASLSMEAKPSIDEVLSARDSVTQWKRRLEALMKTAGDELNKSQRRYKRSFDRRVRLPLDTPVAVSFVFLRKDYTNPRTDTKHKLAPLATGPHKVVSYDGRTVVVQVGDEQERVSRDRVVPAPTPSTPPDGVSRTESQATPAMRPLCNRETFPRGVYLTYHQVRSCRKMEVAPAFGLDKQVVRQVGAGHI